MTNKISYNPNLLEDVLPGLYVYIISEKNEKSEGIVEKPLGVVSFHPDGIKVKLVTGEIGRTKKIVPPKDNVLSMIKMAKQLKIDLLWPENENLEYKQSFAYDIDKPEFPKKFLQHSVLKTVQAFANANGGRLYIGIHDKTHKNMGLSGDYAFLDEGKQDSDGFEIHLRSFLRGNFEIGGDIFNSVHVEVFPYDGKDVCLIDVTKSDVAFVSVDQGKLAFYVREGGQTEPKTITEFLVYWPKHLIELERKKSEFWN
jgi:uncharacterized repeat protein (TIGR03833 family)